MDLLLVGFIVCCGFLVAFSIYRLITTLSKPPLSINVNDDIKHMSPGEKSRYMVNLLVNGYVKRHILTNDAAKRSHEEYLESYCSFLNDTNVTLIKKFKGCL